MKKDISAVDATSLITFHRAHVTKPLSTPNQTMELTSRIRQQPWRPLPTSRKQFQVFLPTSRDPPPPIGSAFGVQTPRPQTEGRKEGMIFIKVN